MLRALQRLDGALQAEPVLAQQSADRGRRDAMSLPGQLLGQMPQGLGRPPQRRHRIAALVRLHQRVQFVGAPATTTQPAGTASRQGSSPYSSSKTPLRTVVSLTPAVRTTNRTPPWPSRRASVANAKRC